MKDIFIALTLGSAVTGVLAYRQGGEVENLHLVFGVLATITTLAVQQTGRT